MQFPKTSKNKALVLLIALALLIGIAIGAAVSRQKGCVSIFEMTRPELMEHLAAHGYTPMEEWAKDPDLTRFKAYGDKIEIRVVWRHEGQTDFIDSIQISRTTAEHSLGNAEPVLKIWGQIQPDIVPLFKHLYAITNPYRFASDLKKYKDTTCFYAISQNNKYWVKYGFSEN